MIQISWICIFWCWFRIFDYNSGTKDNNQYSLKLFWHTVTSFFHCNTQKPLIINYYESCYNHFHFKSQVSIFISVSLPVLDTHFHFSGKRPLLRIWQCALPLIVPRFYQSISNRYGNLQFKNIIIMVHLVLYMYMV